MRASSSEPVKQEGSGSSLRRVFRFRRSGEIGRPSMVTTRRVNSQGWEIKLGPLQVVVWLGLALGSIFGAYFIGFFSGRYVGFEEARTASGVDVPRLALGDDVQEKGPQGWDNVYGKLGGAAVVTQDNKDEKQANAPKKPRASEPQSVDSSPAVKGKGDLLSDTDAIFTEDVGGSAAVVDDTPSKEISGKGGEVRVLGRDAAPNTTTDVTGGASPAIQSAPPAVVARKAEPAVKKEKVAITKSLPKGYFAQVAAPKTRAEAEDLARKIRASGFPVMVEDNSTGRSPFFRVMVGPEDNKVQADRMLEQLKRESYVKGKLFVRQVK